MVEVTTGRVAMEEGALANKGFWGRVWSRFRKSKLGMSGLVLVVAILVCALCAPLLTSYDPGYQDGAALLQGPGIDHVLGTDQLGRDVWSRLLYGARVSLLVASVTSVLAMSFGTALGAVSGWLGGKIDEVLMRVVDVLYSFPDLLLIIIVSVFLGQGVTGIIVSLSLVSWVTVARVVRGEVLSIRTRDFVEAARALGFGSARILLRHVLPHTVAPVVVTLTFRIPAVILAESTLSFIGLGLQPPASSWGVMAASGWSAMAFYPHLIVAPALAIFLTILGFNLLGDGLRDAMGRG